jgi:DNA polymerase III epsilon subunit-like protein
MTPQEAYLAMERLMVQTTVKSLFERMRGRFRDFPNNYLAVDTETTGVSFDDDLIWQVGHCLVKDGKVANRDGFVLNWVGFPGIDSCWLKERIEDTRRNVEFDAEGRPTGRKFHISYERMAKEGVEPEPILRGYLEWFKELREQGYFFVAHNGYQFDANMFQAHFRWLFDDQFTFGEFEIFDSGMVCKAAQSNLVPWPGDSVKGFCQRAYSERLKGVRWSLGGYAVPTFGLDKKHNLNMTEAHDASFDAYVCHLLFEDMKDMTEAQVGP